MGRDSNTTPPAAHARARRPRPHSARGPANRGGFTAFPNSEIEALVDRLTPEQLRLYVGLRFEAVYGEPSEITDAFRRVIQVDVGEVLFGIESASERYGMGRDQVRRAVDAFVRLGLVEKRTARAVLPATPPATPPTSLPATPTGREAATPPTILRFLNDRDLCWPSSQAATPPAGGPATPPATLPASVPATIQPVNQEPTNQDQAEAEAAPRREHNRLALGADVHELKLCLDELLQRNLALPTDAGFLDGSTEYLRALLADHGVRKVADTAAALVLRHDELQPNDPVRSLAWVALSSERIEAAIFHEEGAIDETT